MRTVGKRRARNQPCQSPSPDLHNRSILQNTCIEVENIRNRLRQAETRNIKLQLDSSDSMMAPLDLNQSIQHNYYQLHQQFLATKAVNKQLKEENAILVQENRKLVSEHNSRSFLPLSKPWNNRPLPAPATTADHSLKLLELKNQQLEKDLEVCRKNEGRLQEEVDRRVRVNRDLENQLFLLSEAFSVFQKETGGKLASLQGRISQVKGLERLINEKQSRLVLQSRQLHTPPTGKRLEPKTVSQDGHSSFYYGSPAQDSQQQLAQDNFELKQQLRFREQTLHTLTQQLRRTKEENEVLLAIRDESGTKKLPLRVSTPKFSEEGRAVVQGSGVVPGFRLQPQSQSRCPSSLLQELSLQNSRLRVKLTTNESQYLSERSKLLQSIEHHKKLLKSYENELRNNHCQACPGKDNQIEQLKTSIRNLDTQDIVIQKETRKIVEDYEAKLQRAEQAWQLELRQLADKGRNTELEHLQLQKELALCQQHLQKAQEQLLMAQGQLETAAKDMRVEEVSRLLDKNYSLYREVQTALAQQRDRAQRETAQQQAALEHQKQETAQLAKQLVLRTKELQTTRQELEVVRQELEMAKEELAFVKKLNEEWSREGRREESSSRLQQSGGGEFRANQLSVLGHFKSGSEVISVLSQKIRLGWSK